jgi:uncharacterized protein YxjI
MPVTTPPQRAAAAPYDSSRTRSQNEAAGAPGVVDPVFERDKFLLRQKALSISEKYFVFDEHGAPLMFVERPRHFLRNFGALLVGLVAAIIVLLTLFSAADATKGSAISGVLALLAPILFLATLFGIAIALSKKRHITFHRGDSAAGEKLLEVKQEKKFEMITATYTLRDNKGRALGMYRKNYLYNIIRKRWEVRSLTGAVIALAKEDSILKSLLRRVLGPMMGLLRTNFVFMHPSGSPLYGAFNRTFTILDRYVLDLTADSQRKLDRRIALALGVLLDTGERR